MDCSRAVHKQSGLELKLIPRNRVWDLDVGAQGSRGSCADQHGPGGFPSAGSIPVRPLEAAEGGPDEADVAGEAILDDLFDDDKVQSEVGVGYEDGPVRVRHSQPEPSKRERERHTASGHVPYRAWCRACISGKGKQDPHQRRQHGEIPVFGIDYAYM